MIFEALARPTNRRRRRTALVAVCAAALAAGSTASAQPPARGNKGQGAQAKGAGNPRERQLPNDGPAQRSRRQGVNAAAVAYMAGKQSLLGWHAPSAREIARDERGQQMLVLTTINRGETLAVPASGDDGGFDAVDLDRVAHLLRAATGEEHPIDPRTLSVVYRIEVRFDAPEVRVVSGYRVPKRGSHSNHGKGRAMDIIVPGVADQEVATFARGLGFVGVGVYPTSQFVHVDVRPQSYFWVDYSGPHMKNRELGILGDIASQSDSSATARGQSPVEPFAIGTDVDAAMRARGMTAAAGQPDEDDEDD